MPSDIADFGRERIEGADQQFVGRQDDIDIAPANFCAASAGCRVGLPSASAICRGGIEAAIGPLQRIGSAAPIDQPDRRALLQSIGDRGHRLG